MPPPVIPKGPPPAFSSPPSAPLQTAKSFSAPPTAPPKVPVSAKSFSGKVPAAPPIPPPTPNAPGTPRSAGPPALGSRPSFVAPSGAHLGPSTSDAPPGTPRVAPHIPPTPNAPTPNAPGTPRNSGPPAIPSRPSFASPPPGNSAASPQVSFVASTTTEVAPKSATFVSSTSPITVAIVLEGGGCVELEAADRDAMFESSALGEELRGVLGDSFRASLIIGDVTAISAEITGNIKIPDSESRRTAVEQIVSLLRRQHPFDLAMGRVASRGREKPVKGLKLTCKVAYVNDVKVAPLPPGSLGGQPPVREPRQVQEAAASKPTELDVGVEPHQYPHQRSESPYLTQARGVDPPMRNGDGIHTPRDYPYQQRPQSPHYQSYRNIQHQDRPAYEGRYDDYDIDRQHMVIERRHTPIRASYRDSGAAVVPRSHYGEGEPQYDQRRGPSQWDAQPTVARLRQFYNEQQSQNHVQYYQPTPQNHQPSSLGAGVDFHNQCVNKYFLRRQRSLDAPQATVPDRQAYRY